MGESVGLGHRPAAAHRPSEHMVNDSRMRTSLFELCSPALSKAARAARHVVDDLASSSFTALVVAAAEVRRCTYRAVHEACAPKAAARSLATGHSATFAAQAVHRSAPVAALQCSSRVKASQHCFSCALSMVNELNGYN